jgi:hypothetical protein
MLGTREKQSIAPKHLEIIQKHLKVRGVNNRNRAWQPGKVKSNKLNTNITYPAVTNYWTPLYQIDKEEATKEEETQMLRSTKTKLRSKSNTWKRRIEWRHEKKNQKRWQSIIIDLGATLHYMSEDLNLPRTGPSQIKVYLPDDSTLQATSTTQLPFQQLSTKAREANILSGLKRSLLSVNKMAENGCTTIFRPGDEGVTIHKKGTLTITTTKPPVLQGCKRNGANLWTVTTQTPSIGQEEAANVYSLPSMGQTIKYLHTAAEYPVEETWTKAINAGKYSTWPGLTTATVRKHFPESDETKKGHMKSQ